MSIYISKNNQSKKISKIYAGINGESKKINKGYVGINNQSKLFYNSTYYNELSYLCGDIKAYINTHLEFNEYYTIRLSGVYTGVAGSRAKILGYENYDNNNNISDSFFLSCLSESSVNTEYKLGVSADEISGKGIMFEVGKNTASSLTTSFEILLLFVDSDSPNELKCRITYPSGYDYICVDSVFNSEGYPLLLFTTSNHGTPMFNSNGKFVEIYNVQIMNRMLGYKLIMDLVPCRRNDGVLGMYDKINKNFYQNEGEGNFTAGTETSTIYYD